MPNYLRDNQQKHNVTVENSSPRRKVAFLLQSFEIGGTERNLVTLANGLSFSGFEVEIWALSGSGPISEEIADGIIIRNLCTNKAGASLARILRTINQSKPDALFTAITHLNVLLCIAKLISLHRFKLIISERGNLNDAQHSLGPLRSLFLTFALAITYPIANKVIAVSAGVGQQVSKALWFRKTRVQTIYAPILTDRSLSVMSLVSEHRWLIEPRFSRKIPVVVAAGRLSPVKDFATLLTALSIINSRQRVRLIILGDGELRNDLEKVSQDMRISNEVDFRGFVSDPIPYFYHADCVVSTSLMEGLPSVLVQALDVGAPIVATDCNFGPREFLSGGPGERLVKVGDPSEIADAIEVAIRQPRGLVHPKKLEVFTSANSVNTHARLLRETLMDETASQNDINTPLQ